MQKLIASASWSQNCSDLKLKSSNRWRKKHSIWKQIWRQLTYTAHSLVNIWRGTSKLLKVLKKEKVCHWTKDSLYFLSISTTFIQKYLHFAYHFTSLSLYIYIWIWIWRMEVSKKKQFSQLVLATTVFKGFFLIWKWNWFTNNSFDATY